MSGSGRSRSRPSVSEMTFYKVMDAASPELALAAMRGDAFDEIKFTAVKASGAELLKYLTITLTKCMISRYKMMLDNPDMFNNDRNVIAEKISIVFESIDYLYVTQADDHSQGEERQMTYDIPAGV
jgi:type VI secretion system secreted protein Hcp